MITSYILQIAKNVAYKPEQEIELINVLIEKKLAKNERSASGMIKSGDVYLCGVFRDVNGQIVPYEHRIKNKFKIKKSHLDKFTTIKVGSKYKLI